jgi:hypothetical protein
MITILSHKPTYKGGRLLREMLGRNDGQRWFSLADVIRNIWPWINDVVSQADLDQAFNELRQEDLEDDLDWEDIPDSKSPNGFRRATIINQGGMNFLASRADTLEGRSFTKWLTHDVAVISINTGSYTVPQEIPTGPAANPLDAFGAIYDVMKNQDARIDVADEKGSHAMELGKQNQDEITVIKSYIEDDWVPVGDIMSRNNIAPDSLLTNYQLDQVDRCRIDKDHWCSAHLRRSCRTLREEAVYQWGCKTTEIAEAAGIIDEVRKRKIRRGGYDVNQYPLTMVWKALDELVTMAETTR